MTRYLGSNKILNTKNIEFNSPAIFPVWRELPMLRSGQINVAGIRRRQEAWKIALSEKIALLLHRNVDVPCSLVVT